MFDYMEDMDIVIPLYLTWVNVGLYKFLNTER